MADNIRYVFTSSNTSIGFHTFIPDLIEGLKKVYILKGPAGSGKSSFIRSVGQAIAGLGYEVEFWISAIEPLNPDGVYIPQLKIAVINGSLPKAIDLRYLGSAGELINLGEYINKDRIKKEVKAISDIIRSVENHSCRAYNRLKKAEQVNREARKHHFNCLDERKLYSLISNIIKEIFQGQPGENHYFASALTTDGMVNYVDEISSACAKRYIIRGPCRSRNSIALAQIAATAREKGLTVEYYHCGLNPENLLMIVIRSLRVAVISLANAEIPLKPWDVIFDVKICPKLFSLDPLDINTFKRNYESLLADAKSELENVYKNLIELKKIYSDHMDFKLIDKKREELVEEISQKTY